MEMSRSSVVPGWPSAEVLAGVVCGVCVLGGVGASELALRRSRLGCRGRVAGVSRVLLVSVFLGARNCAGLCIADWWAVLVSLGGVGIDLPRRAELLS